MAPHRNSPLGMGNPKRLERKLDKLAGRVNRSQLAKELISALSNLGQLARLQVNVEESANWLASVDQEIIGYVSAI